MKKLLKAALTGGAIAAACAVLQHQPRRGPQPACCAADGQRGDEHDSVTGVEQRRRAEPVPLTDITGEYFEQVLDGYFEGWRDGYGQAISDVEQVLDDQTNE